MITIIILSFNDEIQIEACLKSSFQLTNDVIVVDSYSKDRTEEICKKYGARFYKHKFENQAKQFNWAIDNLEIANEWVLRLDSDEVIPKDLRSEIKAKINEKSNVKAYTINRRMYWMGKWLKNGGIYPHYIDRLFRFGFARYEEKTEEHLIVNGVTEKLENYFFEFNRKNNLEYFTQKHLSTAKGEISEILYKDSTKNFIIPSLFGNKVQRTRWIKLNFYERFPLFIRPFLYFLYRYLIKLGFLDGIPGLTFHVLQAFWYRFYIDALIYEKKFGSKYL